MKRVGTITASASFIFIGVWMIINNMDVQLANKVFNWWPALIVLLGLEILIVFNRKSSEEKIKLNYWVIPSIIILICFNLYVGVRNQFGYQFNVLKDGLINMKDFNFDFNFDDSKKIDVEKTLEAVDKNLNFNINNGDIEIKRSLDGKIKLDLDIYIDRNSNINNYDIKEKTVTEGYNVDIKENYIRKVKGYIYIPDGMDVYVNANNFKIEVEDEIFASSLKVKGNNGNLDVKNMLSLDLDINNGKVDVEDVKNVKIKNNNGSINLEGKIENIDAKMNNGKINIENKICKSVNARVNVGEIKLNTEDKNLQVEIDVNQGKCEFNEEKRINSGIVKTLGSGVGKVKLETKTGYIKVENQEW